MNRRKFFGVMAGLPVAGVVGGVAGLVNAIEDEEVLAGNLDRGLVYNHKDGILILRNGRNPTSMLQLVAPDGIVGLETAAKK